MYRDKYIYFFLCVGQAILSRAGPFIWESLSFIYQTEAAKMRSVLFLSLSTPMWERLLVGTGRFWEVLKIMHVSKIIPQAKSAENRCHNMGPGHVPQHGPRIRPTTWIPNTSHIMCPEYVPQHGPRTHADHMSIKYRSNLPAMIS